MRRLFGLFLIGLLHAVFLFVGDILVTYAILGVPLYVMRNLSVRRLCQCAFGFWLLSVFTQSLLEFFVSYLPAPDANHTQNLVTLHQTGSFSAILENRVSDRISPYIITPLLFAPEVMGMFLLGLAVAKTCSATGLDIVKPKARKIAFYLWLPALVGNGLYALTSFSGDTSTSGAMLALAMRGAFVPMLTLTYLSIAALVLDRPRVAFVAALLGGEGRLSLSIYIGESLLMGFIALSYGLGL